METIRLWGKSPTMNILLSADAELPVPPKLYGGIERIIDSLCTEFRRRNHQVHLLAHRDSTATVDEFQAWPGITSTARKDSWNNAMQLRSTVHDLRPDIIHSFSRLLWLLPLWKTKTPRVMSYQREPTGRTVAWSRRIHGKRLEFTGCSHHIAETGRQRGGGVWHAIPNFIDPQVFTPIFHVPADAPLVFLSRLERIKGVHNAIAIARGSGRRLQIAGNIVETNEGRRYWRDEIEPHLGHNGIEYIGPVNDAEKNTLLGAAAAMVVPIEWDEPYGIVFAEALACGTPIIGSPRGSLPEIVREGITGFLVKNPVDGIKAVDQLDSLDRSICRSDVENRYSVGVVADQYIKLYHDMLNS